MNDREARAIADYIRRWLLEKGAPTPHVAVYWNSEIDEPCCGVRLGHDPVMDNCPTASFSFVDLDHALSQLRTAFPEILGALPIDENAGIPTGIEQE